MVDILHRIGVKDSTPDKVFDSLTTLDGLAGWWSSDTVGEPGEIGGRIEFRFVPGNIFMKVLELAPSTQVLWEVVDEPDEWVGTTVKWDIKQEDDYTIVLFSHQGWQEATEFMHHCSTKWATFLMSLKSLLETGTGSPSPRDVAISNWH
jgi:uncharacterized protein YndB with AHSA1/START domain